MEVDDKDEEDDDVCEKMKECKSVWENTKRLCWCQNQLRSMNVLKNRFHKEGITAGSGL